MAALQWDNFYMLWRKKISYFIQVIDEGCDLFLASGSLYSACELPLERNRKQESKAKPPTIPWLTGPFGPGLTGAVPANRGGHCSRSSRAVPFLSCFCLRQEDL